MSLFLETNTILTAKLFGGIEGLYELRQFCEVSENLQKKGQCQIW